MKLFMDTEFTGLHKNTTLISIGIVAEGGETFYAELDDYDKSQVDDWTRENVIKHLQLTDHVREIDGVDTTIYASKDDVSFHLKLWLETISKENDNEKLEIWADVMPYDWILFVDLVTCGRSALDLPDFIYYIPFDLATFFKAKGIDPDISRYKYASNEQEGHNSLNDAMVLKKCYDRLSGLNIAREICERLNNELLIHEQTYDAHDLVKEIKNIIKIYDKDVSY